MEPQNGKFYSDSPMLDIIHYLSHLYLSCSQLVCRKFDSDMERISNAIFTFLKSLSIDVPFSVEELNHMVLLAYYDKEHVDKDVKQLGMHRDQRWSSGGKFMNSSNSQQQNTATCILTLGDTRDISFQCYKDNDTGDKKGPIMIDNEFSSHKFCLKHGSLFILHPRDEITMLRIIFDEYCSTYFKHGNVFFGKDGISIGLAFRTTFRTANVNAETGQFILETTDKLPHTKFQKKVDDYIADSFIKDMDDAKRKSLSNEMMEKYFV